MARSREYWHGQYSDSQFLNPTTAPNDWWVKYPGVPDPVAATQFVGIAALEADAASYASSDPAIADKIGIFGYDRQTNMRDITDGMPTPFCWPRCRHLSNVPGWLAAATFAVGVPKEQRQAVRFHRKQRQEGHDGRDGRQLCPFHFENVSDEVFKALSTIKGNESVILNREAPKVEPPADFVAGRRAQCTECPRRLSPDRKRLLPASHLKQDPPRSFLRQKGNSR